MNRKERFFVEQPSSTGEGADDQLRKPPKPSNCQLCDRKLALTFHHLIPRKVHSRTRFKKDYTKAELNRGVWLCRDCHRTVHRFHDELELAKDFNTLDKLKSCQQLERHLEWQRKQKRQG